MDIKWKKFSYSIITKIIAFILVIITYAGLLTLVVNGAVFHNIDFNLAAEDSYYQSKDFNNGSNEIVQNIIYIIDEYQSEENILSGNTITAEDIRYREEGLYQEFEDTSRNYDPDLSTAENYAVFQEVYLDRLLQVKEELIQEDLREYREMVQRLNAYEGLVYYAQKGEIVFTNSPDPAKEYFKSNPAYMIFEGRHQEMFPEEIYFYATSLIGADDIIYIGFTDEFIQPRQAMWRADKNWVTNNLNWLIGLAIALALAFISLLFIIGRKPEDDEIHLNSSLDKIYTDINLALCLLLIAGWAMIMFNLFSSVSPEQIFIITAAIAIPGLLLVLSLIKHIKNRTFFTHSLTYYVFSRVFGFVRDIFNSGSTAVKIVLIVILYPIIAGLTFFMLPITIAVAAWLALRKVKEYDAVKEGVKQVKEGDLDYKIDVPGDGEFAALAADINSITDGLNKAVENEIKSERLKSELITNVSHDIRTPLTSIITYVDLLKGEQDLEKIAEYVEVLDQKAQRLKLLTDDLFEAAKATSGNIPVNYERIDLISLLTQGLGEFDDQIKEKNLEIKLNHSDDRMFVRADGKLLWRAIENLLLNITKYAQPGSRVYIDISETEPDVILAIKNISAYELNISAEELMERFTRGDTARSSQGSGLGLSIAQSLLEIQNGSLKIEIDGDLFKAIIQIAKDI